jgi:general secretion pathway protein H
MVIMLTSRAGKWNRTIRNADCGLRNESKKQNPKFAIRNPQLNGFTLIELMVVIVVLGVILSFVIPRLGELGEANLKRSARHLTGMIRFLRDDAQAKKVVYRLRFDVQGGHYWPEILTQTSDKTMEFKRLQSVMASEDSLSGQTTFKDVRVASHPDDPYIQFTPDGWVERAAIHLRDGDNKDFTLWVNSLTGNTELLEGYGEER